MLSSKVESLKLGHGSGGGTGGRVSAELNTALSNSNQFITFLQGVTIEVGDKVALRHPIDGKFNDLTYHQMWDTVDTIAHQLGMRLHAFSGSAEVTVGYVANSHVTYILNLLALLKLGVTPVLLSPRSSAEDQIQLLQASNARAILFDEENRHVAQLAKTQIPNLIQIDLIYIGVDLEVKQPRLGTLGGSERVIMMLHSSGTTNLPKLIKMSNRYALSIIRRLRLNPEKSRFEGTLLAVSPLSHLFGLINLIWVFSSGGTVVFPTATSPEAILSDALRSEASLICLLPYQLKQLAEHCDANLEGWETLSKLNYQPHLDTSRRHPAQRLRHTEVGYLAVGVSGPENMDCRKLRLLPGLKYTLCCPRGAVQMRIHTDDEGLATGLCHREGYLIGDHLNVLYRDEDGLEFEVVGRVDDTLAHLSGEKTYPIPMENGLLESPLIDRCVILNANQVHNCLLLQLNPSQFQKLPPIQALREIYATVDRANAGTPTYSHIDRNLIYILPLANAKELPITVKYNVSRSKAKMIFQAEIKTLYANFHPIQTPTSGEAISSRDVAQVMAEIETAFKAITSKSLNLEGDLFEQGLDSLSAVKLNNRLATLYPEANLTTPSFTIGTRPPSWPTTSPHSKLRKRLIERLAPRVTPHPNKLNVLVTGANGSLGAFLIKELITQPWVDQIYAVVRADNRKAAKSRVQHGLESRKIHLTREQHARIHASPYFAMSERIGTEKDIHIIYHVAWRMDFLRRVTQFQDCLESTVDLLRISATSPYRPTFHFVSSIGAALPVIIEGSIPERALGTRLAHAAACTGYNLSKLIAEAVSLKWADRFKLKLHIHRIGQISGDTTNGVWSTQEHIPLLIKASQTMKMLPNYQASASWIPVDVASAAMVELDAINKPHPMIHHIANPNLTPWETILDALATSGLSFQRVEPSTFIRTLRSTNQNPTVNRIAPLTEFWEARLTKVNELTLATHNTQLDTSAIRNCPQLDFKTVARFVEYWRGVGFL
ncbi:hypothetical protein L0F63_003969 [Massospora cicadina]|nr:hypothetical protein L0F63_003969 [Massospora cicadina]